MTSMLSVPLVHGTRSTNEGYAYRNGRGILSSLGHAVFFDDFFSTVTTNVPAGWAAAIVSGGGTVTQATANGFQNGVLRVAATSAASGAVIYLPRTIQLGGSTNMFLETRFQTNAAGSVDFWFGLTDLSATTNPQDLWTTASNNVAAFGVDSGSTAVRMFVDKSNSNPTAQVSSTGVIGTNNMWFVLGLELLSEGRVVNGYINGDRVLTWSGTAQFPDGVILAPFVGFRNGTATGNLGNIDYFHFSVNR